MTLSVVQSRGGLTFSSGTSKTMIFDDNFVAGDSAVIMVQEWGYAGTVEVGSVTDTSENTWVADAIIYQSSSNVAITLFHANGLIDSNPTITFTAAQTDPDGIMLCGLEIGGGPITYSATNTYATGTSTTPTTNAITPVEDGALLFASYWNVAGTPSAPTNGFTMVSLSASYHGNVGYLVDAADASISTGMTMSASGLWVALLSSYIPSPPQAAVGTGFFELMRLQA